MRKQRVILIVAAVFLLVALAGCGSETVEIKLLPKDANRDKAPQVVVEPDKAPFNLSGWRKNNVVSWTADIPKPGNYEILIEYSRPGNEPKAHGLMTLRQAGKAPINLKFSAHPTGKNSRDWSVYTINDNCGARLEKGKLVIAIRPRFDSDYVGTEYFMNLRSVTLRMEPEET